MYGESDPYANYTPSTIYSTYNPHEEYSCDKSIRRSNYFVPNSNCCDKKEPNYTRCVNSEIIKSVQNMSIRNYDLSNNARFSSKVNDQVCNAIRSKK